MSDIGQKHMRGDTDATLDGKAQAKELYFNETLRHGRYKHLDGVTFDTYPSTFNLAAVTGVTGGDLVGIDPAAFTRLTKNNTQDLMEEIDANLVKGPASATDNAIPKYDSTTGKLIQNSGVTISDADVISSGGLIITSPGTDVGITFKDSSAITRSVITLDESEAELLISADNKIHLATSEIIALTIDGSQNLNAFAKLLMGKVINYSNSVPLVQEL